jgi:hypothetical protein
MALQLYKIATVEVGSAGASSIDFTSIPQGYTDLKIVMSARTTRASFVYGNLDIRFNGATTNRSAKFIEGSGSSVASFTTTTGDVYVTGATATANAFENLEIYIPNYTSSNYKSYSYDGVNESNTGNPAADLCAGLWSSTAPITSITFTDTTSTLIVQYSTFTLYGIL